MLDRVLSPEQLPELLAESDFVVLAAPLTEDTHGLIDEETIGQVKPGAWVINVARGELIDELALARAIRDGRLGGAVLDTFREEPLPPTSPFYDLPNVILTPHTSWSSTRVLDRSWSCSATTCGATRTDGRCSTWWTRTPGTDRLGTVMGLRCIRAR